MHPLRTALAFGLAFFALSIPTTASADTPTGTAKTLAATLDSTGTLRVLMACHSTPACQRTAARSLATQIRTMTSDVLLHTSRSGCDLLPFERAYGPTQNALAAWATRPNAIHARVAMGALKSWYSAMGATKTCAS
jgi:hypothetical protein